MQDHSSACEPLLAAAMGGSMTRAVRPGRLLNPTPPPHVLVAARKRCFPAVRTRFREVLVLDRGAIHAWPRWDLLTTGKGLRASM